MPLNAHWQRIGVLSVLGMLGMLGFMPGTAQALDCLPAIGRPYTGTFSVPALNLDPSVPVGTVIGTTSFTIPRVQLKCIASLRNYNTVFSSSFGTYDASRGWWITTNVAGIGYRVYRNNIPVMFPYLLYGSYFSPGTYPVDLGVHRVDFVRTGRISGGSIVVNVGAHATISSGPWTGNGLVWYEARSAVIPADPRPPTCSVSPASQQVSLGNIVSSAFGALNAEAGSARATLSFVCSGLTGGATRTIRLTLTDATMPANRSSNLSLTAASTARGLAVRMRNDGTPISYGPDSSAAGNPGQFLVKAGVGNETVSLPLDVSYVRTGTVTAGSANATATFTVRYE